MDVVDYPGQRVHPDRLQRERSGLYLVDEYGTIVAAAYENLYAAVYGQVTDVSGVRFRALQEIRSAVFWRMDYYQSVIFRYQRGSHRRTCISKSFGDPCPAII